MYMQTFVIIEIQKVDVYDTMIGKTNWPIPFYK